GLRADGRGELDAAPLQRGVAEEGQVRLAREPVLMVDGLRACRRGHADREDRRERDDGEESIRISEHSRSYPPYFPLSESCTPGPSTRASVVGGLFRLDV